MQARIVRPESVAKKERLRRIEEMTKALVAGKYYDESCPSDVINLAIDLVERIDLIGDIERFQEYSKKAKHNG
jgi:hypothetical protein